MTVRASNPCERSFPASGTSPATRMPVGHASVASGTGPARGRLTRLVTSAVWAGSGCPALSRPPGSATPAAEIGARSPGPKTWFFISYAPPAAITAVVTTAAALMPAGLDAPRGPDRLAAEQRAAEQKRRRGQDAQAAAVVLERRAKRAARRARGDVSQRGDRRAVVGVVCAQQVGAHVIAVGAAGGRCTGQRLAGTQDEAAAGSGRDAELGRDLLVRQAVDLAAQQRVALALGQVGDVGERGGQPVAPLEQGVDALDARRLVAGVQQVQGDRVGARPRDLVQAAVAHEAEEVGPDVDVTIVAAQRAVRAHERLLHDVVDERRLGAQDAAREASQCGLVARAELGEGARVARAQGGEQLGVRHADGQAARRAERLGAHLSLAQMFLCRSHPRVPKVVATRHHCAWARPLSTNRRSPWWTMPVTAPPGDSTRTTRDAHTCADFAVAAGAAPGTATAKAPATTPARTRPGRSARRRCGRPRDTNQGSR